LAVIVAIAAMALELWQQPEPLPPAQAVWPVAQTLTGPLVLKAEGLIPQPPHARAAHASTLLALPLDRPGSVLNSANDAVQAFWFAGKKENAPDVQIAMSAFDRATQQWSAPRFVVNRERTGSFLGYRLRRLGNPVVWRDTLGRNHLFVVANFLGGWASSRILHLRQDAPNAVSGADFVPQRTLPLSWFWSFSFLVRSSPLPLADGGMMLPVHFELGRHYPMAVRFDEKGGFRGMTRISRGPTALQPTLVARGATEWMAYMRSSIDRYHKVQVARTTDSGRHWEDLPPLHLDNYDSSIVGLALCPGRMVLAYNPRMGRSELLLAQSQNGADWTRVATLEQSEDDGRKHEFSYPALAWVDNSLWVSYTHERKAIAWQRFEVTP
jgi:predicted neuraminidase